jgi:hypothetical protein
MLMFDVWADNGYLECRIDLENLPLPSGDKAHLLAATDLYRELTELGVPGITVNTGRHELLVQYGRFLKRNTINKSPNVVIAPNHPPVRS